MIMINGVADKINSIKYSIRFDESTHFFHIFLSSSNDQSIRTRFISAAILNTFCHLKAFTQDRT